MPTLEKQCSKCTQIKPLSDYYKHKKGKDGTYSWCKSCHKILTDAIRKANPDKVKECHRKWCAKNIEKKRESSKKWKEENAVRYAETMKLWKEANKDLIRKGQVAWKKANPERVLELAKCYREKHADALKVRSRACHVKRKVEEAAYTKKWQAENREKYLASARKSQAKKRATPKGALNNSMSSSIHRCLKSGNGKGGKSWRSLVDFTLDDLKSHLERRFKNGMSWGNYGAVWHVDHKIPIAAFNFEKPEDIDFKRCWSLKNLCPLLSFDNWSKGAKLNKPFQPSLTIKDFGKRIRL